MDKENNSIVSRLREIKVMKHYDMQQNLHQLSLKRQQAKRKSEFMRNSVALFQKTDRCTSFGNYTEL